MRTTSLSVLSGLVALLLISAPSSGLATSITVVNPGFDDTTGLTSPLAADNQLDFATNPYVGWTEYTIATGVAQPNGVGNNVGPINVAPGDIAVQATSGLIALYHQSATGHIRTDQTTGHVIGGLDLEFTLAVDVGNDASVPRFGGYVISLFADDGLGNPLTSKVFIDEIRSSIDGGNPVDNSWLRKSLTITLAQIAPHVGKNIGISFSNETNNPLFYDTVTLDVVVAQVPEPGTLGLLGIGVAGMIFNVRRRRGGVLD